MSLKGKPVQVRRGPATVSGSPLYHATGSMWPGRQRGARNTSQETCLGVTHTPSGERVRRGVTVEKMLLQYRAPAFTSEGRSFIVGKVFLLFIIMEGEF